MNTSTTTYRKRPVAVEARQFNGGLTGSIGALVDWITEHGGAAVQKPDHDAINIETLEGTMTATFGDWIVRGVAGEFYPVKPDIFEATYEPIEVTAKTAIRGPRIFVADEVADAVGAGHPASQHTAVERAELEKLHPVLRRFTPVGTTRSEPFPQAYIAAEQLRSRFYDAAAELCVTASDSKSRAVALTELETAMMWALRAFYGAPGEGGA